MNKADKQTKQVKYLIIGRSGAGKDTLANMLKEQGLKGVLSCTTRPKRTPTEDTHIFIDQSDVDKYPNKVATTTINGYHYFATKEQVEECDYYVIDPQGAKELCENMPKTKFHIVYVDAPYDVRMARAIQRADDKDAASKIFIDRHNDEDDQFSTMETIIKNFFVMRLFCQLPSNVVKATIIENSKDTLDALANSKIMQKYKTKFR